MNKELVQLNDIKKKLGYSSVPSMLSIVNQSYKNMMRLKADNPTRYTMIIDNIVKVHYRLSTDDLLNIAEMYREITETEEKHKAEMYRDITDIKEKHKKEQVRGG